MIEKMIDKIRERLQELSYEEYLTCEDVIRLDDAINIINQVEAEYDGGWISVNDKLPEDDSYVLVTEDDDVYMAYYDEKRQAWYYDTEEGFYRTTYIDAWMPLPEPCTKGE